MNAQPRHSPEPDLPPREHPTRTLLIETARSLLADRAVHTITADMVLTASGVSKGSLYHHFEDFDDLLGTAMAREFAFTVQENIDLARDGLARCDSTESVLALLGAITRRIRTPAVHQHRMNRVSLMSFARGNEKFRRLLATEQSRLTSAMTELFVHAQQRGWLSSEFDPRAGAVLLQSCHFGQVADEISDAPLRDEAWVRIMDMVIRRVFAPPS